MMKLGLFVSLVIILLSLELGVCDVTTNSTTLGCMCIQREKAALLSFKSTLSDPVSNNKTVLPSWHSSNRDCCSWEAVTCHKITGHVITLDLTKGNKPYEDTLVANTIDSSLLGLKHLTYLDLSSVNFFTLKFPAYLGSLKQLQYLNLSHTCFCGVVPQNLGNLSSMRTLDLNVGGADLEMDDLMWASRLSGTSIYSEGLFQVIKGVDQEYTRNFQYVVNLDLSSNHLVGEIPWELTILSGLLGLNLSHNHLKGQIPTNIGDMKSLESLDLSNNNLQGMIPYGLSSLSFLSKLNLSNNNFSGQIPGGRQLQVLEDPASIYQGNPLLCGAPLLRKCDEPDVQNHKEEDEDKADKIWSYGIIIAGFATGFWAVIGSMVVKTKWRQAYFR